MTNDQLKAVRECREEIEKLTDNSEDEIYNGSICGQEGEMILCRETVDTILTALAVYEEKLEGDTIAVKREDVPEGLKEAISQMNGRWAGYGNCKEIISKAASLLANQEGE